MSHVPRRQRLTKTLSVSQPQKQRLTQRVTERRFTESSLTLSDILTFTPHPPLSRLILIFSTQDLLMVATKSICSCNSQTFPICIAAVQTIRAKTASRFPLSMIYLVSIHPSIIWIAGWLIGYSLIIASKGICSSKHPDGPCCCADNRRPIAGCRRNLGFCRPPC